MYSEAANRGHCAAAVAAFSSPDILCTDRRCSQPPLPVSRGRRRRCCVSDGGMSLSLTLLLSVG